MAFATTAIVGVLAGLFTPWVPPHHGDPAVVVAVKEAIHGQDQIDVLVADAAELIEASTRHEQQTEWTTGLRLLERAEQLAIEQGRDGDADQLRAFLDETNQHMYDDDDERSIIERRREAHARLLEMANALELNLGR